MILGFIILFLSYFLVMNSLKSLQLPKVPSTTKFKFVLPEPNYQCVCCGDQFVYPYQLQCGHRICDTCNQRLSVNPHSHFQCPSGDSECIESEKSEVSSAISVKLIVAVVDNIALF